MIWNDLGCARLGLGVKSKNILIGHWLQFSRYGLRVFMKGLLPAEVHIEMNRHIQRAKR